MSWPITEDWRGVPIVGSEQVSLHRGLASLVQTLALSGGEGGGHLSVHVAYVSI